MELLVSAAKAEMSTLDVEVNRGRNSTNSSGQKLGLARALQVREVDLRNVLDLDLPWDLCPSARKNVALKIWDWMKLCRENRLEKKIIGLFQGIVN